MVDYITEVQRSEPLLLVLHALKPRLGALSLRALKPHASVYRCEFAVLSICPGLKPATSGFWKLLKLGNVGTKAPEPQLGTRPKFGHREARGNNRLPGILGPFYF